MTNAKPIRFTLNASERLKQRKLIETLFRQGKAFFVFPYKVIYRILPANDAESPAQAGFSASKRYYKHAVDRNRVKRLSREAYRLHKHELYAVLEANGVQMQVFFLYSTSKTLGFEEIQDKFAVILKKLKAEIPISGATA